jgi:DNA-directed RNA polymerase specialized sigma24 family protein
MPNPFRTTKLLAEVPRLRRYARILTGDAGHADHLVQRTLARASLYDEWASESTRRAHLFAMLREMYAQEAERTPTVSERSSADAASDGVPGQSPYDSTTELVEHVRNLPLELREVLVLVAVERMSYAEIATLLHLPVATVISRLVQARERLHSTASAARSTPNAD